MSSIAIPRHSSGLLHYTDRDSKSLQFTFVQWSNNYTLISLTLAPKAHDLGFLFQVKAHTLSTELLLDVQPRIFSADLNLEPALHAFIYKIFPVFLAKGFVKRNDVVLLSLNFPMEVVKDPSKLLGGNIE
jgi:hypothetical protein